MLWLVYRIAFLYSRSRLAGVIAILLVLFNASLTFLAFFEKYPLNPHSFIDIITAEHFTSFGPWDGKIISAFWNLNIYTNQRHLSLAFGLSLLALYPLIKTVITGIIPSKRWWYLLAPVFMVLPWIHQASIVMIAIIVGLIFVGAWSQARKVLLPYLVCMAFSLPGYIYWQFVGVTSVISEYGYLSPDKTVSGIAKYWLYNLGLYLPFYRCFGSLFLKPGE
jgi:hypothetical protein